MYAPQPIPSIDVLSVVSPDTRLHAHGGREYVGPCPSCGGKDRFTVSTARNTWFCRQCSPKRGDAPGYLMWRDGVRFPEALRMLEAAPSVPYLPSEPPPLTDDDREWFATLAYQAHQKLISARGVHRREWLAARGIDDASMALWGLGYNPTVACSLRAGHTIPLQGVDGLLHGVTVRQHEGEKYMALKGSRVPLFGQPGRAGYPLLLVESQFDAILLHRLVGEIVDVAALGTAKGAVEGHWYPYLLQHPTWLVALDSDAAGEKAAASWQLSARTILAPVPDGFKDPSQMWVDTAERWDAGEADAYLRAWINGVLLEVAS